MQKQRERERERERERVRFNLDGATYFSIIYKIES